MNSTYDWFEKRLATEIQKIELNRWVEPSTITIVPLSNEGEPKTRQIIFKWKGEKACCPSCFYKSDVSAQIWFWCFEDANIEPNYSIQATRGQESVIGMRNNSYRSLDKDFVDFMNTFFRKRDENIHN